MHFRKIEAMGKKRCELAEKIFMEALVDAGIASISREKAEQMAHHSLNMAGVFYDVNASTQDEYEAAITKKYGTKLKA